MTGPVAQRIRDIVREESRKQDVEIMKGHVSKDHVHVFVSIPPNVTISRYVQKVKGKSSYKLLHEFPHLRRSCWGRHFWARGYFCRSSGNVTDEVIKAYIEGQEVDGDDNFRIDGEASPYTRKDSEQDT